MYSTIFEIAILGLAALFVLWGIFRGKRFVWMYSAMRLGVAVLSLVLSLILSRVIAKALSGFGLNLILDIGALKDFKGLLNDLPSGSEAVTAILSMILAPLLFLLLFFVMKAILNKIAKIVAKAIMRARLRKAEETAEIAETVEADETAEAKPKKKKQKKYRVLRAHGPNPIGMLCGAACSLLVFFVLFVPFVGTIGVADSAVSLLSVAGGDSAEALWATPVENGSPVSGGSALSATAAKGDSVMGTVEELVNAAANNVGSQAIRALGGGAIYDSLTTYEVGGHEVSLVTETKLLSAVGGAVAAMADTDVSREEAAGMIRQIAPAFSESSLIPTVVAEFLQSANESWEKGESYYGIDQPSFGEDMEMILDPLWDVLASSTYDTVKTDVGTVVEVLAVLVEKDAVNIIKEDPMSLFEDEELSTAVLSTILSNERMDVLVGEIAEFGIQMLGDELDVDLDNIDLNSDAITDKAVEARAMAIAFSKAIGLIRDSQDGSFDIVESIETVGPLLDAFCGTQTVGRENAAEILSGILMAESVYKEVGFTLSEITSLSDTINQKAQAQGYSPLMRSLSHTIDVVQLASDVSSAENKEEMNAKVETLIQDLTPESAEVLQEISSPSVMQNYGVPEQSAEPTADMVSSLFGNLSAAKESGMSEEEYQKEAQATTDLLNLAMTQANGEGNADVFGENSATGKTASDYVDTVFSSTVVSQTIVQTAYPEDKEDGEPVVDPLSMNKTFSEEEQTEVLNALNEQWNSASEEEKSSEDYQKTYLAVGAILNIPIQITEGGVVITPATQG